MWKRYAAAVRHDVERWSELVGTPGSDEGRSPPTRPNWNRSVAERVPHLLRNVIVADANGYYDDMCLDVEITPSFSTANYPLVAENDAQFASGGSFSEVASFAAANDAELVAVAVEGPTAIDSLIVKPGVATELTDLEGTTIGVKGKLPPSVAALRIWSLAKWSAASLSSGACCRTSGCRACR